MITFIFLLFLLSSSITEIDAFYIDVVVIDRNCTHPTVIKAIVMAHSEELLEETVYLHHYIWQKPNTFENDVYTTHEYFYNPPMDTHIEVMTIDTKTSKFKSSWIYFDSDEFSCFVKFK